MQDYTDMNGRMQHENVSDNGCNDQHTTLRTKHIFQPPAPPIAASTGVLAGSVGEGGNCSCGVIIPVTCDHSGLTGGMRFGKTVGVAAAAREGQPYALRAQGSASPPTWNSETPWPQHSVLFEP